MVLFVLWLRLRRIVVAAALIIESGGRDRGDNLL